MTLRRKAGWAAAILGLCAAITWATFPAVVYLFYWFVYPIYYYPFRHRSLVAEFPMTWEVLPAGNYDGSRIERPTMLRFEENPNFSTIIAGEEIPGLREGERGKIRVVISMHGDRLKGVKGFSVQRVGPDLYKSGRGSGLRSEWRAPLRDPGLNPLDRTICGGPCPKAEW